MDDRPQQRILTLIAIALTFASGATDVASYTRLGNVFTSVMTGNIVLLGLAVARHSLTLASHTLVSIAGYIAGVAGGTWIANGFRAAGAAQDDESRASGLPGHVGWALLAELILLCGLTVGWEIDGASPAGWARFCLLATAATAMGVQSSAVKYMGLSEVSTTYLTGTLTGLVSSLVNPKQGTQFRARRFGVLIGLATGAALSGLLVATAADAVPALPLAALATCLFLASAPRRWDSWLVGRRADEAQQPDAAQRLDEARPDAAQSDAAQSDAAQSDAAQSDRPTRDVAQLDRPMTDVRRPGEAPADEQRPGEAPADGRRPGELEPGGR
jgi:uncharacterized membrane protein YoaK (UPF0700 family)